MESQHPTSEQLVGAVAASLDDARKFLVEKDLVTLPSEVGPKVEETPPFARAQGFAFMDTAQASTRGKERIVLDAVELASGNAQDLVCGGVAVRAVQCIEDQSAPAFGVASSQTLEGALMSGLQELRFDVDARQEPPSRLVVDGPDVVVKSREAQELESRPSFEREGSLLGKIASRTLLELVEDARQRPPAGAQDAQAGGGDVLVRGERGHRRAQGRTCRAVAIVVGAMASGPTMSRNRSAAGPGARANDSSSAGRIV